MWPMRFWSSRRPCRGALDWLTSATDKAREQADERLQTVLGQLDEMGAGAAGAVGADDPLLAFDDAVRQFAPDHLLIGLRPGDRAGWRRTGCSIRSSSASDYRQPFFSSRTQRSAAWLAPSCARRSTAHRRPAHTARNVSGSVMPLRTRDEPRDAQATVGYSLHVRIAYSAHRKEHSCHPRPHHRPRRFRRVSAGRRITWPESLSGKRDRSSRRTRAGGRRSYSSTGSGCCRVAGIAGPTCSRPRAMPR